MRPSDTKDGEQDDMKRKCKLDDCNGYRRRRKTLLIYWEDWQGPIMDVPTFFRTLNPK